MKKNIIIFTEDEIRNLKLKKKDNYYIIHKSKLNKRSDKKCNKK